jgi:hypothetical protein
MLEGERMRVGAHPIGEQILVDLLVPPIGACFWWAMARGWAMTVQSGNVSEATRKRQRREFLIIMALVYLLMFGITLYGRLTG